MQQRTIGNERTPNAFEPPAVGSHTTKSNHNIIQSEGGNNGEIKKTRKLK